RSRCDSAAPRSVDAALSTPPHPGVPRNAAGRNLVQSRTARAANCSVMRVISDDAHRGIARPSCAAATR
ncbi:MAG TPA: hypothetical protein VF516_23790, partial [Kofleriaceae bacterium]